MDAKNVINAKTCSQSQSISSSGGLIIAFFGLNLFSRAEGLTVLIFCLGLFEDKRVLCVDFVVVDPVLNKHHSLLYNSSESHLSLH